MKHEFILEVGEFSATAKKLQIEGWSTGPTRQLSIVALPSDVPAPKIGQRVKITIEYAEEVTQ